MAKLSITAERLNALKAKVKTEMQRRNAVEHNHSLSGYGDATWDYTSAPKAGSTITDEHIVKVIDPLIEVNDFLHDNSFRSGKSGSDEPLLRAEEYVDRISKIDENASNSGCRGNCAGLCVDSCFQSCKGGCYSGCSHTCGFGCQTSTRY